MSYWYPNKHARRTVRERDSFGCCRLIKNSWTHRSSWDCLETTSHKKRTRPRLVQEKTKWWKKSQLGTMRRNIQRTHIIQWASSILSKGKEHFKKEEIVIEILSRMKLKKKDLDVCNLNRWPLGETFNENNSHSLTFRNQYWWHFIHHFICTFLTLNDDSTPSKKH